MRSLSNLGVSFKVGIFDINPSRNDLHPFLWDYICHDRNDFQYPTISPGKRLI